MVPSLTFFAYADRSRFSRALPWQLQPVPPLQLLGYLIPG